MDSSSDLRLRHKIPQPLAHAYAHATAPFNSDLDRLNRRLGFVDLVQRYIAIVLMAEVAGLGLPLPQSVRVLQNNIQTPSLGQWGRVGTDCATLLEGKEHRVAPDIASMVILDGKPTEVGNVLRTLVGLRDRISHNGSGPMVNEDRAAILLKEHISNFTTLFSNLHSLASYLVVTIESKQESWGAQSKFRWLVCKGSFEEMIIDKETEHGSLPTRLPLLISEQSNHALVLAPLLMFGSNIQSGIKELRLVERWDQGTFLYSDLHAENPTPIKTDHEHLLQKTFVPNLTKERCRIDGVITKNVRDIFFKESLYTQKLDIEGYKLLDKIGRGATSTVWRAKAIVPGRRPEGEIALKVLDPIFMSHSGARQRFRSEYEILKTLVHPGIVKVLDFGTEPCSWIAMRYIQGEDLQSRIENSSKPFSPHKALQILEKVLEALQVAHRGEVIHRDIKPSNVMLDRDGQISLIDFGIAQS